VFCLFVSPTKVTCILLCRWICLENLPSSEQARVDGYFDDALWSSLFRNLTNPFNFDYCCERFIFAFFYRFTWEKSLTHIIHKSHISIKNQHSITIRTAKSDSFHSSPQKKKHQVNHSEFSSETNASKNFIMFFWNAKKKENEKKSDLTRQ